jgi:hypothetical protein
MDWRPGGPNGRNGLKEKDKRSHPNRDSKPILLSCLCQIEQWNPTAPQYVVPQARRGIEKLIGVERCLAARGHCQQAQ